MSYYSLRNTAADVAKNLRGWRTTRKIIVFESDDWGSIRMPSREVYEQCLKSGYRVDTIAYEKYDSLATQDDLEKLFSILTSFRDYKGNKPVITANVVVANPDFNKIEESDYQDYHYELITETFKKYPNHARCFELWNKGINDGVFYPQSHGREHLNVKIFMDALKMGDSDVHFGFKKRMPGMIPKGDIKSGNQYVEALAYTTDSDKNIKLNIILEGLQLFEDLFGYRSKSFIPPNYLWSPDFDKPLSDLGVRIFQGNWKMKEPKNNGNHKIHHHYIGKQNVCGQIFLIRNAVFEPTLFKMNDISPVDHCLKRIKTAFMLNKPAIICSHRINYVGTIDTKNRDLNLLHLNHLLENIQREWPDVEYMTSVELGELIANERL